MQTKNEQQRIPRPFDFLNNLLEKKITIDLKESKRVTGILISFDIHLNVVIKDQISKEETMYRGDAIYCFKKGD